MDKRTYKITEEQYKRLTEDNTVFSPSDTSNKPETIIKTNRNGLNAAAQQASSNPNVSGIEIENNNTNEGVITKKELVSEARKEWKSGTKVVKMSELLKN